MVEGTVREACATFFCYCILHLEGQDSASFPSTHSSSFPQSARGAPGSVRLAANP